MNIRHIIRNTVIGFFEYTGISWFYRFIQRRHGPLTRIIVFHDVPDAVWFETMITTLARETNVLSPEEFFSGACASDRMNTCITFDDGYASWTSVALPLLRAHGLKALFFVNSGLLDVAHSEQDTEVFMRESLEITPRVPLTWSDVVVLQDAGHTIGGHTRTHPNLVACTTEESRREVQEDKDRIESKLGNQVTEFAYPFGTKAHVNAEVAELVRTAGYIRGYTTISRFVDQRSETFLLPRMCIETGLSAHALILWLGGGYDLFDMIKK